MGVFKNRVGGPSEKTKRKRMILGIILPLVLIGVIARVVYTGYKKSIEINTSSYNISASKKTEIIKKLNCKSGYKAVIDEKTNKAWCERTIISCTNSGGYPNLDSSKKQCYKYNCNRGGTYIASRGKCNVNPSSKCPSGYTYSGSKCYKEDLKSYYDEKLSYSCPSGYQITRDNAAKIPYCVKYTSASYSYTCPSGYTKVGDGPTAFCLVEVETRSYTQHKVSYSYSCPSGYNSEGSYHNKACYKWVTTKRKSYTPHISNTYYTCPSGYTKSGHYRNSECYKYVRGKKVYASHVKTTSYSCPSGYLKEGSHHNTSCYKLINTTSKSYTPHIERKSYSCPSGYISQGSYHNTTCYKWVTTIKTNSIIKRTICPSGWGVDRNRCYKYSSSSPKVTATFKCKNGTVKRSGSCYIEKPSNSSTEYIPTKTYNKSYNPIKTEKYNTISIADSPTTTIPESSVKSQLAQTTVDKVWKEAKDEGYDKNYTYGELYLKRFKDITGNSWPKTTPWCAIFVTSLQHTNINGRKIANYVKINSAAVPEFLEYFLKKKDGNSFHYNTYCDNYKSNYLGQKSYTPKVGDYAIFSTVSMSTSGYCGQSYDAVRYGQGGNCHAHIGIVQKVENNKVYVLEGNTNEEATDNHSHVQIIEYNYTTSKDVWSGATRNICKIVGFGSWY